MKTDLVTSIAAAIVGTLVAFFACNFMIPKIEDYEIKTLGSETSYDLVEPNVEVFNFRAINPTVEVYVGHCESGDCGDNVIIDVPEDDADDSNSDNKNATPETSDDSGAPEDQTQPGTDEKGQNGTTD